MLDDFACFSRNRFGIAHRFPYFLPTKFLSFSIHDIRFTITTRKIITYHFFLSCYDTFTSSGLVFYTSFFSLFFSFLCSNTGLTLQSPADKERYNTECFVAIALTFLYLLSFLPIFIWFLLLFSSQIQYCNGLRKRKRQGCMLLKFV